MDNQKLSSNPVGIHGLAQAQQLFAAEGLAFPILPASLASRLTPLHEWVFGTRLPPVWLYEIDWYTKEFIAGDVGDYILLGHAGHGANSWAIHCYIVYRGMALLLQIGYGGAYMEPEVDKAHLAQVFHLAGQLLEAVESTELQPARRFAVVVSDFYGSRWGWVEPEMDWHRDPDTLKSALQAFVSG